MKQEINVVVTIKTTTTPATMVIAIFGLVNSVGVNSEYRYFQKVSIFNFS